MHSIDFAVPPPTEGHRPGRRPLDCMSALEIVQTMNGEDAGVVAAVGREAQPIAAAIDTVAQAFRKGGRLFYVGAGTSGRLGALDASECPPTFGVDATTVVALIAGGDVALRCSAEGAEDRAEQGVGDLRSLAPPLNPADVVVGISASGTTPYVVAALAEAKRVGAKTVLLCCNPNLCQQADLVVAVDTGPEVLAGSTRLKAGTAAKMVLNMITTGAMALSGRVYQGRMVGLRPSNAKLRRRAVRMVAELAGMDEARAASALAEAHDDIAVAVLMEQQRLGYAEASDKLERFCGNLRAALLDGS